MTDHVPHSAKDPKPDSEASYAKRRQLLQSGLSASLLLTTVASRSAWGGDKCTRSGLNSANLSGQHTFPGCGKSAGYWGNADWPSAIPKATLFTDKFGSYPYPPPNGATLFAGKSLYDVIWLRGNNAPGNLGLHLVGAYVNSIAFPKSSPTGKGFVYSPAELVTMFQNAISAQNFREQLAILRDTLEAANNQYDRVTDRYVE